MEDTFLQQVKQYLLQFHSTVSQRLLQEDPVLTMRQDEWQRPEGGGGITRAFGKGNVFEKAGVNFSHVWGQELPLAATVQRPELKNCQFEALGVSIIVHPENPFVPTCHANIRFFSAHTSDQEQVWWFGGGFDLTPYYAFDEDCIHWHKMAKQACDPFGQDVYQRYKAWADRYFYLQHRQEPRGIGGLFFDDLNEWQFEKSFAFLQNVGENFMKAYFPIVSRRKNLPYTEDHRRFQLYRRGRYVEFNLLYDRGTLFGIQSGGRTESILISLPPLVSWEYDWKPFPGSPEEALYTHFLQPRDWINYAKEQGYEAQN